MNESPPADAASSSTPGRSPPGASKSGRVAVIIGAGPAGLTAALELLRRTDVRPIVLEQGDWLGGISRTAVHNGNRIDIGGHRFFSKSDRVMRWWLDILPMQGVHGAEVKLSYQGRQRLVTSGAGPDPALQDAVMLLRPRRSRIFTRGRLFDYPISLSLGTLRKLGLRHSARIGLSYARASLSPRPEHSLEDFLINRFGSTLYETFFRDYTEKVWGVPCDQISAAWGAQRIKGLNLRKAAEHFFRQALPWAAPPAQARSGARDDAQETSLIEQFLYPKYGPGQLWEAVAEQVRQAGGEIRNGWRVVDVKAEPGGRRVTGVVAQDADGQQISLDADFVFSTMPVRSLVRALSPTCPAPAEVREVSEGLVYRDFITVGLLVDRLKINDVDNTQKNTQPVPVRDNWIYVQEPGVLVGRVQIYNNWSPWLVADPSKTWIGLEYFCDEHGPLWNLADAALMDLARAEAARVGLLDIEAVRDQVVIRVPKTYPAYFGSYDRFDTLQSWVDRLDNLILIGRNGMHRYNNQDHSVLSAMVAVDQIAAGLVDKAAIWAVNTEQDYQEERA